MKFNPNIDCKAGKTYKLGFRTGGHLDRKKEAKKLACRNWKKEKGSCD